MAYLQGLCQFLVVPTVFPICGPVAKFEELCERASVFFMPQKPYMFLGSLKEQLLYPHVEHHIPDVAIEDVLQQVRLDDLLLQHGLSETR